MAVKFRNHRWAESRSSDSALYLRTYVFARNFNWLRLAKCLFFVMVLSSTVFSCNRFDGAAEAKESLLVAKGGHEETAKKRWSGSWSSNIGVVSKFSGFPDHISSSFFFRRSVAAPYWKALTNMMVPSYSQQLRTSKGWDSRYLSVHNHMIDDSITICTRLLF